MFSHAMDPHGQPWMALDSEFIFQCQLLVAEPLSYKSKIHLDTLILTPLFEPGKVRSLQI